MPVNPKIYGHLVLFDNRFVESVIVILNFLLRHFKVLQIIFF